MTANLRSCGATLICLTFCLAGQAAAKEFMTLFCFRNYYAEGARPHGGVTLSSNVLYGTTKYEGSFRYGIVFAINPDGSGFTNLHDFNGSQSEGAIPEAALTAFGDTLFGATRSGGAIGAGTLFRVNIDGTDFRTLHLFSAVQGSDPTGKLLLSEEILYGTTSQGGVGGSGVIFRINPDGTGFSLLHEFSKPSESFVTNWDGATPMGGLIISGDTFFGTASRGGDHGSGTVFALDRDGSNFRTIYSFSRHSPSIPYPNNEGANPQAGLAMSGDRLFGTARNGGHAGNGTIFSVNRDGTGFETLHSFPEAFGSGTTNVGGIFPVSELVVSGSTLYGTAAGGGDAGFGTLFSIGTDSSGFSVLHSFSGSDGANPIGGLVRTDDSLYGTTADLGYAYGTVFRIAFFPQLSIGQVNDYFHLTWPHGEAGFDFSEYYLERTTDIGSLSWTPVNVLPLNLPDHFRVTLPVSRNTHFYRLRRSP